MTLVSISGTAFLGLLYFPVIVADCTSLCLRLVGVEKYLHFYFDQVNVESMFSAESWHENAMRWKSPVLAEGNKIYRGLIFSGYREV